MPLRRRRLGSMKRGCWASCEPKCCDYFSTTDSSEMIIKPPSGMTGDDADPDPTTQVRCVTTLISIPLRYKSWVYGVHRYAEWPRSEVV